MNTLEFGHEGEQIAADWLSERGFAVAERNWRKGRYELDIIAFKDGVLHIVEVKLRKRDALTSPEDAITRSKFDSLCRAARAYVAQKELDVDVQFDLVAVEHSEQGFEVRYVPNVMTPRW